MRRALFTAYAVVGDADGYEPVAVHLDDHDARRHAAVRQFHLGRERERDRDAVLRIFHDHGDRVVFGTDISAEGGYLTTHVEDVYWKATISCQHAGRGELIGRASEPGFPDDLRGFIDSLVYTYRPNIVSLVLALDRLPHLEEENNARRAIRRSGQDPTRLRLPGCDEKVATSIEIPWNYVRRDDHLVADMAGAFRKVEANLAALADLRTLS